LAPDDNVAKPVSTSTKKIIFITLVALIILGAGAAAGMHFTSKPEFCASCHQIQPQVVAWRNGPHNTVDCLSCHAEPGTVGYVERKLGGLKEVYLQVTNQIPAKIEAKPHLASCIACHTGGNSKYPNAKNLKLDSGPNAPKLSHATILKDNYNCLGCHKDVGHARND